jgi:hypothetical protein
VVAVVASGPPPIAFVAASLKVVAGSPVAADVATAGSPVAFAAVDSDAAPPVASVARGKHFYFPLVLEDTPLFSVHAKGSSGSKSTLRREVIQLYRISHRELEKRLSIACSVYFVDKGGDSRIEVRDVG